MNMFFKTRETKAVRKEKGEIIKTLKHNDLSNQLTLEICDSAFFRVANYQIRIYSQIETLASSKRQ